METETVFACGGCGKIHDSYFHRNAKFCHNCGTQINNTTIVVKATIRGSEKSFGRSTGRYEQKTASKFIESVHPTGPGLINLFLPGTRVIRGPDWQWKDQDGGVSQLGTVVESKSTNEWLSVEWDNGSTYQYRMGAENCYDLQLIGCPNDIINLTRQPISEELSRVLLLSPLPSHLECEICLEVLSDPVQTSCCGQGYCKSCIDQVKTKVCPHCRGMLEVFPDKKCLRLINTLKMKCPYHIKDKCQWKGSSSELKDHLKVCDIKPMTCSLGCGEQFEKRNKEMHIKHFCSLQKIPCKYCHKQVMKKDIFKHHEECPKIPLLCPNKCSSKEDITREKMKEHITVCPDQVVKCKYFEFGCLEKEIKRKEHDKHLSSSMEKHLYLVAEYARNERNSRKLLEEKIATIERKLKKLT